MPNVQAPLVTFLVAIWLWRVGMLGILLFNLREYRRSRHQPPDWTPPGWASIVFLGPVDRDRYVFNAGCGAVGAALLLVASVVVEILIQSAGHGT